MRRLTPDEVLNIADAVATAASRAKRCGNAYADLIVASAVLRQLADTVKAKKIVVEMPESE